MFEALEKWSMRKCKWWQFWMPQSGFFGGIVVVSLILLVLAVLYLTNEV